MLGSSLHIKAQMVHSIGADDHGMFSVFEQCRLERNGSLEMHRWGGGAELAGGSCQVAGSPMPCRAAHGSVGCPA